MELQPRRLTSLPLLEISGFAVRGTELAGYELVAISDEDWNVLRAPILGDATFGEAFREELWRYLPPDVVGQKNGSDFEGVAADGSGRVFLLREAGEQILIMSPELNRLERVVSLVVEPAQPEFGKKWAADKEGKAKAEGLLLLRGGHVLVAKQQDPVQFIEFGPPGDEPRGVSPDSPLGPDEPFALRGEPVGAITFAVLAWWGLAEGDRDRYKDVNDLAADPDGRIHFLSSESRRIGRLEPLQPGTKRAAVAESWDLPHMHQNGDPGEGPDGKRIGRRKPEALAILADGTALVGADTKLTGHNVMIFAGLH